MCETALRTEALAARAAGDPNRAVLAWRALLDRAPEDWRLALELKRDLKAGLHYPDSDPRFRRAARHLPDAAWLEHYASLYAFHGSDLVAIDARARALLAAQPGEARQEAMLQAILGDVARQRRDWAEAERAFSAAQRLAPEVALYAAKAEAARRYADLAARAWPEGGLSYSVSVVNLDRNAERMVEIAAQFAGCPVPVARVPAVEGSRLPAAAVRRLTGRADSPRGTLGCFLSHAAAWEGLLLRGDAAALIVEDDVIPLLDLPPTLAGLDLPEGWNVVFVNDRLEPPLPPPAGGGFALHRLAAAMAAFHPEDNAPGADGYLLSRAGAETLLGWVGQDGMAEDVDWRMVAYGMSGAEVAAIPAHSHARRELERLGAALPRVGRLSAWVLQPALIRTVGVSSDREDENRVHG